LGEGVLTLRGGEPNGGLNMGVIQESNPKEGNGHSGRRIGEPYDFK